MLLEDHPKSIEWLKQFRGGDRLLAVFLLRSVVLVSEKEFSAELIRRLDELGKNTKKPLAVFSVTDSFDPAILDTCLPPTITHGSTYGSEDRIGHTLTKLAKTRKGKLLVNPSLKAMRSTKLDDIVLVDDLIGSGRRMEGFWKSWANATLRSWLSGHHFKLHIWSYGGHQKGIERVKRRVPYLMPGSLVIHRTFPKNIREWNTEIVTLIDEYGSKTGKTRAKRGVGNIMLPLVFQHGCPNNAPSMLWSGGKTWKALFPEGFVDPDFDSCFSETTTVLPAETLWKSRQLRLALSLLDEESLKSLKLGHRDLLVVLGLLAQRMKVETISALLVLGEKRTEQIVNYAKSHRFIDDANKITQLGKGVLDRARWKAQLDQRLETERYGFEYYFPKQYDGVQR